MKPEFFEVALPPFHNSDLFMRSVGPKYFLSMSSVPSRVCPVMSQIIACYVSSSRCWGGRSSF